MAQATAPVLDSTRCDDRFGSVSWCKDRWGFTWQITPRQLNEGMADPDRAAAKRVFEAMMTMLKIDVTRIEAARRGNG
jgi:predicted 3-demethylubiquinone-9 3-methyltransferase (glyoxalase superfamily)